MNTENIEHFPAILGIASMQSCDIDKLYILLSCFNKVFQSLQVVFVYIF